MSGGWLPPTDDPPLYTEAHAAFGAPATGTLTHDAAVRRATYEERAGAAGLDFLIRVAIALPFVLAAIAVGGANEQAILIGAAVGAALGLLYAPIMMTRTGGQTVGHRVTQTRIERKDGQALVGGSAALREVVVKSFLFEGAGSVLFSIPTAVNYLWPLWDADDEALHDKLCGTRVVKV